VSLTRGEGFGLPLLEAAASGVPVIATNWSAHTEFLSLGRFIDINYDLIPIPEEKVDERIFMKGVRWADPHEDDFKNKILKFRKKNEIPDQWAKSLSQKIQDRYSSNAIQEIYDKVFAEILNT
jgi:glycosyltransferase involved in cell wall biosynthesis